MWRQIKKCYFACKFCTVAFDSQAFAHSHHIFECANTWSRDLQSRRSKLTILNWGYFFTRRMTTCEALFEGTIWVKFDEKVYWYNCNQSCRCLLHKSSTSSHQYVSWLVIVVAHAWIGFEIVLGSEFPGRAVSPSPSLHTYYCWSCRHSKLAV